MKLKSLFSCPLGAYTWILSLVLLAALSGCQDYQPFDNHSFEVDRYERAFVKEFGKPAADHEWGFIEQPVVEFGEVTTRSIDKNQNQFYMNYSDKLNVPGMPDMHGYYRGQNTVDAQGNYTKRVTKEDLEAISDINNRSNTIGNPVGDITAEERDFVTQYFATHNNPTSTYIMWESFFIQTVNSWNLQGKTPSRDMDLMGYEKEPDQWEHINDYNCSNGTLVYAYNAGTQNWTYRSSFGDQYHNGRYNIQHLVFDIPQAPGQCSEGCTMHHYDGWYIGFDYEAIVYEADGSLRNGSVAADGYFDDWIVKVSPGNLVGYPETVRVMCEDLGAESDWDFNDVVFDVSFRKYGDKVFACIAVQAAGGTIPITVGTSDPAREVHKLLGDGSMKPIIHPATFYYYEVEYQGEYNGDNSVCAKNIPIYVNNSEEAQYYTITNTASLTAGHVAQKFACPDYVQWTEESQHICNLYPGFVNWVGDPRSTNVWRSSTSFNDQQQKTDDDQQKDEDQRIENQEQETEKEPDPVPPSEGILLAAEELAQKQWNLSAYVVAGDNYDITVTISKDEYIQFSDYSGAWFNAGSKTFTFNSAPQGLSIIKGTDAIVSVLIVKK